jgi:hypothetical protein
MIRATNDQDKRGQGYNIGDGGKWEGGCRTSGVSQDGITTWARTTVINYRRHYDREWLVDHGGALYWPSRGGGGGSFELFEIERSGMEGWGD